MNPFLRVPLVIAALSAPAGVSAQAAASRSPAAQLTLERVAQQGIEARDRLIQVELRAKQLRAELDAQGLKAPTAAQDLALARDLKEAFLGAEQFLAVMRAHPELFPDPARMSRAVEESGRMLEAVRGYLREIDRGKRSALETLLSDPPELRPPPLPLTLVAPPAVRAKLGGRVPLRIALRNGAKAPVAFVSQTAPALRVLSVQGIGPGPVAIDCFGAVDIARPERHTVKLGPGEEYALEVDLAQRCAFFAAGTYQLEVEFHAFDAEFADLEGDAVKVVEGAVGPATLKLTLEPEK